MPGMVAAPRLTAPARTGHVAKATAEPALVRWTLIGVSMAFSGLFLFGTELQ